MSDDAPSPGESLVTRTARALCDLSLEHEEGAFLGAEEDLLARLAVSRPTLRQAAKIAESERMIAIRRGIKGGIYAARPDATDAIRTLARYLRLKGATLADIVSMSRLVSEEAAALAAGCANRRLRARLSTFADAIDSNDDRRALIKAEGELARLVAEMSGNPAIELTMAISYSFGMQEQEMRLYGDPGERAQARNLQHGLCRAILDCDADVARLMMQRRSQAMAQWLGGKPATTP